VQGQTNQTISLNTAIRRFGDQHLVNSAFPNFPEKQKKRFIFKGARAQKWVKKHLSLNVI